jgi:hypothetical protein
MEIDQNLQIRWFLAFIKAFVPLQFVGMFFDLLPILRIFSM